MKTTKHTPGKWQVLDSTLIHANGYRVATVESEIEHRKANAALIAAAPELYEMVDKINAAFYTRTSRKEWLELMEKTKPLLQKARGE